MDPLTSFLLAISGCIGRIWTNFFGQLRFGSFNVSQLMLAFVFLSMFLRFLLGSFNHVSPGTSRDQRRRTQD